jgi:uncharacterized protein YnzC (UPF0291/DUF896 family)
MQTTPEVAAFDRGVGPMLRIVLPDKVDEVLKFRPSSKLQARIEELAGKSTEGKLTKAEKAEYEGYVRANKFVAILRRQARHLMEAQSLNESRNESPRQGTREASLRILPVAAGRFSARSSAC